MRLADSFDKPAKQDAGGAHPGVTVKQIAKDFGVHPMTLSKWPR